MKTIQFKIDASCGTRGLPRELATGPATGSWVVDELNAFSLIALATAPPTYVGFTLADTWAHQRYAAALDPRKSDLILRKEWRDLDAHQKTILADDWGVGFSLMFLTEHVSLEYFAPTNWWLQAVEKALGRKLKFPRKKKGPPKLPDYIGIDAFGFLHALECKGTQQSQTQLGRQILNGVAQVQNLRTSTTLPSQISRSFRGWMVGGLFVPQATSKQSPLLIIADPDFEDLAIAIEELGGVEPAKALVRSTMLCQQLSVVGLPRLATTLFNLGTNAIEAEFLRYANNVNGEIQFMQLERTPSDRLATKRMLRVFDTQEESGASGRVFGFEYSIPASLVAQLAATIGENGAVNRDAVDHLLDDVAPLARPTRRRQRTDVGQEVFRRWNSQSEADDSILRSPFGVELRTSSYTMDRP